MRQAIIEKALNEFATPFYVFDEGVFSQTIGNVRSVLPDDISLCYAMKANPFLVGCASALTERIEVCSTGEMRICQSMGVPPKNVVVSGVHKDPGLMLEVMGGDATACRYTVESMLQFEMLERTARALGASIPVLVRLSSGNQFGLDERGVRQTLCRAQKSDSIRNRVETWTLNTSMKG